MVGGKETQSHKGSVHCDSPFNTVISKCLNIPSIAQGLHNPVSYSEAEGNT